MSEQKVTDFTDNEPVNPGSQAVEEGRAEFARTEAVNASLQPVTSDSPLIAAAIAAFEEAAQIVLSDPALLVEERNTWQPESWLIQCCWQVLAARGAGNEALESAGLLADRHPNAPLQALYQLANHYQSKPALGPLLQHELQRWHYRLFHTHPEDANQIERLLLVGASAALAQEQTLAATCLERLDNLPKGWERVMARPELRDQLAKTIVHIGPHPLINDLINISVRRFEEAGVQFIQAVTMQLTAQFASISENSTATDQTAKLQRLLEHCLDTLRYATLVTLQSRRIAALVFGQAGQVDDVLAQVEAIENVQSARRATGYAEAKDDPTVIRQVKRTNANSDVDFLVYTLRNAADVIELRTLGRDSRIALADKLAMLGLQSDGWTAASAASTLVELGALRYAVEVVDHITPNDPARSEGLLMLVRSLMAVGEYELAAEQAKRAMDWAESLPVRNPERALTWGLAELYLDYRQPQIALQLLERWREPTGWRERVRKLWGERLDDDGLRNQRLRLDALLQLHAILLAQDTPTEDIIGTVTTPLDDTQPMASLSTSADALQKEIAQLLRSLRRAAPQLLDGEALVQFYLQGLLQPLLSTSHIEEAWSLLPELRQALCTISGNKHTVRVRETVALFAELLQVDLPTLGRDEYTPAGRPTNPSTSRPQPALDQADIQPVIEGFLRDLWRANTERGIWQVVHAIEGTLPLLIHLEDATAILTIAQAANVRQRRKLPPLSTPLPQN